MPRLKFKIIQFSLKIPIKTLVEPAMRLVPRHYSENVIHNHTESGEKSPTKLNSAASVCVRFPGRLESFSRMKTFFHFQHSTCMTNDWNTRKVFTEVVEGTKKYSWSLVLIFYLI